MPRGQKENMKDDDTSRSDKVRKQVKGEKCFPSFNNVYDVTRKEGVREQKCKQTMSMCMILAVLCLGLGGLQCH